MAKLFETLFPDITIIIIDHEESWLVVSEKKIIIQERVTKFSFLGRNEACKLTATGLLGDALKIY